MSNHFVLMAAATVAWTVVEGPAAAAQITGSHRFAVDIVSGPLVGERYGGVTTAGTTAGSLPTITFKFGEMAFTERDDVQDSDANSPRLNFQDGEFLGATFIVSRFGSNPTEIPLVQGIAIDGFAIDNNDFGYLVGANLYRGTVRYSLLGEPVEEAPLAPEPIEIGPVGTAPTAIGPIEIGPIEAGTPETEFTEPDWDSAQPVPAPSAGWGLVTVGFLALCSRWRRT